MILTMEENRDRVGSTGDADHRLALIISAQIYVQTETNMHTRIQKRSA